MSPISTAAVWSSGPPVCGAGDGGAGTRDTAAGSSHTEWTGAAPLKMTVKVVKDSANCAWLPFLLLLSQLKHTMTELLCRKAINYCFRQPTEYICRVLAVGYQQR